MRVQRLKSKQQERRSKYDPDKNRDALALLLSATSATLAQPYRHHGGYYNYYGYGAGAGNNGSADYQPDMGSGSGN